MRAVYLAVVFVVACGENKQEEPRKRGSELTSEQRRALRKEQDKSWREEKRQQQQRAEARGILRYLEAFSRRMCACPPRGALGGSACRGEYGQSMRPYLRDISKLDLTGDGEESRRIRNRVRLVRNDYQRCGGWLSETINK